MTPKSSTHAPAPAQGAYQASDEQIAAWKKEHGDVFVYTADGKRCYLKKPDRNTLSVAAAMGMANPLRYNEILLENCWLGGDEQIRTADGYFLGISQKLSELVEIKEGELKKL